MGQGRVRYRRDGAAVTVTFDRPEAHNALTWAMYTELDAACRRAPDEDGVRVLVLRGAGGKAFVAGTDIAEFTSFDGDDGVDYERRLGAILDRLEALPLPTVAVVEGYAVGGGLALAAACDLRLCTPDARFGLPIARTLGNCVSVAVHARLVGLLGVARTKHMLFTAEMLDAATALSAGLVSEVVAPDVLEERLAALVARVASHAPLTLRATKEAIRRITVEDLPPGDDLIRLCYGSRDFREGVAAFTEKRDPHWQGR